MPEYTSPMTHMPFFYFKDELEPIPCGETPQPPTNVQAYAVSSKQIVVYLSKPFGSGFTSKITVLQGNNPKSSTSKSRDVSPAVAEGVTGLSAATDYNVSVQLFCTGTEDVLSTAVNTTVKTFPEG